MLLNCIRRPLNVATIFRVRVEVYELIFCPNETPNERVIEFCGLYLLPLCYQ